MIGRFVRADPDGHTCWIHSGTRTMQVDWPQVRPACGFENWTPDAEDIAALKTAEANIAKGLVSDARGPGPPDDELLEPEILPYDHDVPQDFPMTTVMLPRAHDVPLP